MRVAWVVVLSMLVLACLPETFGQSLYVGLGGTDDGSCGLVGTPCASLNYAINTRTALSVLILPGNYPVASFCSVAIPGPSNIEIVGMTSVYLNCDAANFLSTASSAKNVTLRNLNFVGGTDSVVQVKLGTPVVTIDNCTFTGVGGSSLPAVIQTVGALAVKNSAFYSSGRIQSTGATLVLNVTHCLFQNGLRGVRAESGVILNIADSTFINCAATGHGGAVASMSATLSVTRCNFTLNRTTQDGGAIVANPTTEVVRVTDSYFGYNSADGIGGAIATSGTIMKVSNCVFVANRGLQGGCIHNGGNDFPGTSEIYNSTFLNNQASNTGGGLYGGNAFLVFDSTFDSNRAAAGGAMGFTSGAGRHYQIERCVLTRNVAFNNSGGAIRSANKQSLIGLDLTFRDNWSVGAGAAVAFSGTSPNQLLYSFVRCVFENNTSLGRASAMYISYAHVEISDSNFTSNVALDGQGAVTVVPANWEQLFVTNCRFVNNSGGAIYTAYFTNITNSYFANNSAFGNIGTYRYGGALQVDQSLTNPVSIYNTTMEYNSAPTGGTIMIMGSVTFTMINSVIRFGSAATTTGGGIGIDANATVQLSKVEISDCTAATLGGGLYMGTTGTLTITDSTFARNSALGGSGGGLQTGTPTTTLTNVIFANNSASTNGGAMSAASSSTLSVRNSVVFGNVATLLGGGIYTQGPLLTLNTSTVSSNTAQTGGGVYTSYALIGNTTFTANTATENGGALSIPTAAGGRQSNVVFSIFTSNVAAVRGGALYLTGAGPHHMQDNVFSSNRARIGGGLYLQNGVNRVARGSLNGNIGILGTDIACYQTPSILLDSVSGFVESGAAIYGSCSYVSAAGTSYTIVDPFIRYDLTSFVFLPGNNVQFAVSNPYTGGASPHCVYVGASANWTSVATSSSLTYTCNVPTLAVGLVDVYLSLSDEDFARTAITVYNVLSIVQSPSVLGQGILMSNAFQFTGLVPSTAQCRFTPDGSTYHYTAVTSGTNGLCDLPALAAGSYTLAVVFDANVMNNALTITVNVFLDHLQNTLGPVLGAMIPTSGPLIGGRTVTLTGSVLSPNDITSITFGTLPVSLYTWDSNTRLRMVSPVAVTAGAVSLTYTSASYGIATGLSYQYNPTISLTSLSTTNGPMAGGRIVTLVGSVLSINDIEHVLFGTIPATVYTWDSITRVRVSTPAAASATSVAITYTSTSYGTATALSYTYNPPPNLVSLSPTEGPLSGGRSLTLSGNILSPNDITSLSFGTIPVIDYTWDSNTRVRMISPAASVSATLSFTYVSFSYGTTTALNFRYNPAINMTAIVPDDGPLVGGQIVTLIGNPLSQNDISNIRFGSKAALAHTWDSMTSVRLLTPYFLTVTTVAITYQSPSYGAQTALEYTFNAPPVVHSVVPSDISRVGGQTITLSGIFGTNITQVLLAGVTVSSYTEVSSTRILAIAGASSGPAATGPVSVTSETLGFASSNAFTYNPDAVIFGQLPNNGPLIGNTLVTLSGSNLAKSTDTLTVTMGTLSLTSTAITWMSDSRILITTPSQSFPGDVLITSSTSSYGPAYVVYHYNPQPTVVSLSPVGGSKVGGITVTITTTNFGADDINLVQFGSVASTTYTRIGSTEIVAVAPAQTVDGLMSVTVYSVSHGTAVLTNGFNAYPLMTITSVSPNTGPNQGGSTVTIDGNNMGLNDITDALLCGTPAESIQWVSSQRVVVVTASASSLTGCTMGDVSLTSLSHGYAVALGNWSYLAAPVLADVVPFFVPESGGGLVTITGSNLGSGADITAAFLCDVSATIISQSSTMVVLQAAALTTVMTSFRVELRSTAYGTGRSYDGSFYYSVTNSDLGSQVTISSITPTNGPLVGGYLVTVFGTNLDSRVQFVGLARIQSTIVFTSGTFAVVRAGRATSASSLEVRVIAPSAGVVHTDASNYFTYNPRPVILSVTPANGPLAGGRQVTINGTNLVVSGGDTTLTASLCNIPVTTLVSQTTSHIVVVTPALTVPQVCWVNISSTQSGNANRQRAFTVNPAPSIYGMSSNNGPRDGGMTITIFGSNLGAGDIQSVQLAGVESILGAQTSTSVMVTSAAVSASSQDPALTSKRRLLATGDVTVFSSSFGVAVLPNAFVINPLPIIERTVPTNGPLVGGNLITILGTNLGNGSDVTQVFIAGQFTRPLSQTTTSVVGRVPQGSTEGLVTVSCSSTHYGLATKASLYRYNPLPVIMSVMPNSGRCLGSNFITVVGTNLGSGNDITSVKLAGLPAVILGQSSTMVVIQTAASTQALNMAAVSTASVSYGEAVRNSSFSYIPGFVSTVNNGSLVEGALPLTIGLYLDAQPASDVLTTLSTFDERAGITVSTLLFASDNWDIPQTFSMLAKDNFIMEGNAGCPLWLSSSVSNDTLFAGLTGNFSFICVDNDVAGIVLTNSSFTDTLLPRTGGYVMIEGNSLELLVRLTSQPLSPVTVSLTLQDTARMYTNETTFVFDDRNWNASRYVTVSSPLTDASSISWSNYVAASTSNDVNYNTDKIAVTLPFLLVSLDAATSVQVSPILRNTSEDGTQSEFYGMLTQEITEPLTATVVSLRPDEIVPAFETITFQPSDYLVPVVIPLVPLHDWIDDDDQLVSIQFRVPYSILGITTTVSTTLDVWNYDIDTAAVVTDTRMLMTNETGSIDVFPVKLASKPVTEVTVNVGNNPSVHTVSSSSLSFNSVTWNTTQFVTVAGMCLFLSLSVLTSFEGVRTFGHADIQSNVSLTCQTTDRKYSALSPTHIPLINRDIYWPYRLSIYPEVWALGGMNGTLTGTDLLENSLLEVRGLAATGYYYPNTTGNYSVSFFPPANFSTIGYANVTVRNPDGGYTFMHEPIFFTNDCPFVGYVGTGSNCKTCPNGAYCPGGNRIWPNPGWWTSGEFSGTVAPCVPAERCLGGRFSSCRAGHTGDYCSTCADKWFMDTNELCTQCQSDAYIGFLFLVQFSFLTIYLLVLYFGSEALEQNVEFVLNNLRVVWLVGAQSTHGIPEEVVQVFSVLRIFVGDMSFINPACTGLTTKAQVFALNVGVSLGCLVPLVVAVLFRYIGKARMTVRYMQETGTGNPKEVAAYARTLCIQECFRALYSVFGFCFEVLLVKSMESLICQEVDGALRLQIELDQICFEGPHLSVAIVACLLILIMGVIFPVVGYIGSYRHHKHQTSSIMLLQAADAMGEPYKDNLWWFGPTQVIAIDLALSVCDTFVQGYFGNFIQLLVQGFILIYTTLIFIFVRPFKDPMKNGGYLLVMAMSITSTVSQLLLEFDMEEYATPLSYAVLALLLLFALSCFLAAMWGMWARKLWRMCKGWREGWDKLADDEKLGARLQKQMLQVKSMARNYSVMNPAIYNTKDLYDSNKLTYEQPVPQVSGESGSVFTSRVHPEMPRRESLPPRPPRLYASSEPFVTRSSPPLVVEDNFVSNAAPYRPRSPYNNSRRSSSSSTIALLRSGSRPQLVHDEPIDFEDLTLPHTL